MRFFLSCDWGTSAFRLRLIDADNLAVQGEIKTTQGIADTFGKWKETRLPEEERTGFYLRYLFQQLDQLEQAVEIPAQTPIIISGMASASIGMQELPYAELPFNMDGSGLSVEQLQAKDMQHRPLFMVSGVCSAEDVARGEETMLVGCDAVPASDSQLFIFPGTHSKHFLVNNGQAEKMQTFMTGELFHLLSIHSILSASLKKEPAEEAASFFAAGVKKGGELDLANALFHVRTNQLFKKATPGENYQYLSGLLIGHELRYLADKSFSSIVLVSGEALQQEYLQAMAIIAPAQQRLRINADEALIKGQWKIMRRFGI